MSMAATPDKKTVVRELMELGKQKGQLTNQDILDAIGEIDFDPEQLEKLYDSLAQLGIEIVEDSGDEILRMSGVQTEERIISAISEKTGESFV